MSPNPFQQGQDVTDLIPAGPLLDGGIAFTFAIYYLPMPAADPFDTLDELLANTSAGFHQVESINGDETEPTVCAFANIDPRNDYPPPDPEFVELFNYGVSRSWPSLYSPPRPRSSSTSAARLSRLGIVFVPRSS